MSDKGIDIDLQIDAREHGTRSRPEGELTSGLWAERCQIGILRVLDFGLQIVKLRSLMNVSPCAIICTTEDLDNGS